MRKTIPDILRICFVTRKFSRGGGTSDYGYLRQLTKSLSKRGHDVSVISSEAPEFSNQTSNGDLKLYFADTSLLEDSSSQESVLDVLENLNEEKPFDIVHCVDNTGYSIAKHKKDLNVAVAVDVKGSSLDEIFGLLGLTEDTLLSYLQTSFGVTTKFLKSFFGRDHKLLKMADGIFVTNKQQQEILERYYLIASQKIHVIPYGVDGSDFEVSQTKPTLPDELTINSETKIILTISPLTNIQEVKNLLTAFERVVIKKPNSVLLIVGDGPRRKELEFHMLSLALAGHVLFLGELSSFETSQYIACCDVYVNLYSRSSDFEPTVLEAMTCKKIVIASEVGTGSGVITKGVDGFLIRPTEILSLTRILLESISGQVDTLVMGERAKQKILKMFDSKRIVDQTVQAYHKIMCNTKRYKAMSKPKLRENINNDIEIKI
jgi:1,2-diacylglycerol 3-alpha-glucosyltransferase